MRVPIGCGVGALSGVGVFTSAVAANNLLESALVVPLVTHTIGVVVEAVMGLVSAGEQECPNPTN